MKKARRSRRAKLGPARLDGGWGRRTGISSSAFWGRVAGTIHDAGGVANLYFG